MNLFSTIKILDLTRVFSGPFATRHFADFGADVIKIEPLYGDESRHFPPLIDGWSGYFEVLNRNKRSLALNLKDEKGLHALYALCKDADVVVENFSSGVTKKLRIDYPTIKKINPKIIYASVVGVSESVSRKYFDVIAQAESGLMSLNGEKEDMKNATSIVDAFAGMKLAFAISGALYGRERTRRGCHIIVSMKGSAFDLLEQNLIASSLTRQNPAKVGNMDSAIAPFGVFRTKDAAIVLAIGSDRQWEVFLQLFKADRVRLGRDAFSTNDVRVKNFRTLQREIERIFRRYSSTKLLRMLTKAAIPCGKVNSMRDVLRDAENYDQELLEIIDHPDIGRFVVPAGGVFFSRYEREKYRPAPQARHTKNYGI